MAGIDYIELLAPTREAIRAVVRGPTGQPLTDADWQLVIGKSREDGGLGYPDKRVWAPLLKQVIEQRLYQHPKYGVWFRRIAVSEAFVEQTQKGSLEIASMRIVLAVFDAGAHTARAS